MSNNQRRPVRASAEFFLTINEGPKSIRSFYGEQLADGRRASRNFRLTIGRGRKVSWEYLSNNMWRPEGPLEFFTGELAEARRPLEFLWWTIGEGSKGLSGLFVGQSVEAIRASSDFYGGHKIVY